MEIHIQLAGIQLGPYSEKQVREYVAEGLLSLHDKAREEGSLQWIEVSELMAKLPPAPDPAPPVDPNAVFVEEDSAPAPPGDGTPAAATVPLPAPAGQPPPDNEPKRAPEAAPGVSHLPTRTAEPDPLTAKTKPLAPLSPTAPTMPKVPPRGLTASKSVSTTAPLVQSTKKMSRTALAKALQNKTEPLPGRTGGVAAPVASGAPAAPELAEARAQVPAGPVIAPETTGPMAPNVSEEVVPPTPPAGKKGGGLPSLLKALTAKTVPMRPGALVPETPPSKPAAATPPPSAPPVPGGSSSMPTTTPLPTRAIMNPAASRAPRTNRPPPTEPPTPAPAAELQASTEKLPRSKKAAELRQKAAEKAAAETTATKPEPTGPDIEPVEEPAPPKRRSLLPLLSLAVMLCAVGVGYAWLPFHACDALGAAMNTGNPFDLEHLVDFDSVRASLKQQVEALATSSSGPGSGAAADATAMLDKSVDLYVTPAGLSNLIAKSGQFSAEDTDQAISQNLAAAIVGAFVAQPVRTRQFVSGTEFEARTDVAVLHLKLQGLGWKLTGIELHDVPALPGSGSIPVALGPVVQTYMIRGQDAASANDWTGAVTAYSKALAIDPKSTDAYNARGLARQSNGDLDGAIKDFTQAITIAPQSTAAYIGRGNVRMARNDLDGAIADFTQAVKIDPSQAIAYDSLGNAKTAKDDLDGAIQDFTQAITIDPNLASAYSDRGFARQANGNLDGAISDYSKALDLKPKTAKTYFSRGLAYLSQNNLQAAIVDFDKALVFDPKIADAYFQRGNAKSALHDTDGAIADFTQTLSLKPNNALAYCSRGVAREDKGDLDGALADYTQALKLDQKIAVAYFRRALIELRKNDVDAAIADTSQALDLDPKNAQAYYYRGFAKMVRDNLDGGATDLKTFCDAAPRDRFADNARLYLWLIAKMQGQGAHPDADQDLSDALENNWNNSADDFTAKTAAFLLGRVTEADYLAAAASTDAEVDATQHCQAYYFAGMKRLLTGDRGAATDFFQRCVATNKKDFCEYILAQAQLAAPPPPPPAPPPAPSPSTVAPALAPLTPTLAPPPPKTP